MNKLTRILLGIIICLLGLKCWLSRWDLCLGNDNETVVRLHVKNAEGIDRIQFRDCHFHEFHVDKAQIQTGQTIRFGSSVPGSGEVSISVFCGPDTLHKALYVEDGYSPYLSCSKDTVRTVFCMVWYLGL